MKVIGNFEYLGKEEIRGRKDPTKTYYNVVLLQDTDPVKVFVTAEDIHLFKDLQKMDSVQCALDINVGVKTYINILDVKKIK